MCVSNPYSVLSVNTLVRLWIVASPRPHPAKLNDERGRAGGSDWLHGMQSKHLT